MLVYIDLAYLLIITLNVPLSCTAIAARAAIKWNFYVFAWDLSFLCHFPYDSVKNKPIPETNFVSQWNPGYNGNMLQFHLGSLCSPFFFCLPVSQLKTVETPKEFSRQLEDSVDYAKVVSCWPQLRITQMVTVSL